MHLWGIGEYGARFPNAICGIISLMLLYHIGKKHFSARIGMLWAACYFGSLLPHLYFKSGIIDPWFNLFIFLSIYQFIRYYWTGEPFEYQQKKKKLFSSNLVFSGILMGLAILTKGPVALLVAGLCMLVYWLYQRGKWYVSLVAFLIFLGISLLSCGLWFAIDSFLNGSDFLKAFITYQIRLFSTEDAGHGGFPGFHLVVLLIGCFPASVFAIQAFFKKYDLSPTQANFVLWMKILFWVVLILFSIVQSKIIHYSSLCYFPLTLLAALTLENLWQQKIVFSTWLTGLLVGIGLLIAFALGIVPILGQNIELLKDLIQDPSGQASLEAEVNWHFWESIVGIIAAGVIVLAVIFFQRKSFLRANITLFGGYALVIWLGLALFINKIEAYSQAAPIAFFESLKGQDVYLQPMHYKTYAHLFYSNKMPPQQPEPSVFEKVHREVEKDVYFITKIHKADHLRSIKGLEELKSQNGFVFFRKKAAQSISNP